MGRRKRNRKTNDSIQVATNRQTKSDGWLRRLESFCAKKATEYKTIGGWTLAFLGAAWILLDKFAFTDASPPIVNVYPLPRDNLPRSVQTLTPFRLHGSFVLHPGPVFRGIEVQNKEVKEDVNRLPFILGELFSIRVKDTGTDTILLVKVKDESTDRAFVISDESFEPFSVYISTTGSRMFLVAVDSCYGRFPKMRVFSNVRREGSGIGIQVYHPLGKEFVTETVSGAMLIHETNKQDTPRR